MSRYQVLPQTKGYGIFCTRYHTGSGAEVSNLKKGDAKRVATALEKAYEEGRRDGQRAGFRELRVLIGAEDR